MSAPSGTPLPAAGPHAPAPVPGPADLAACLELVRSRRPLVHCLTNTVAAQRTADVLLALGANPVMVDNLEEARQTAAVADAVLVNLGTPTPARTAAAGEAVRAAGEAGRPWVLDPVAVGAMTWRTEVAAELLAGRPPAVVRGNASEVVGLCGGAGGRGTASSLSPEEALDAAAGLATRTGTTVAVSGPVDHVTDGHRLVRVHNGTPVLTRVTGAGCALGAVVAAYCAVTPDCLVAAVAATAIVTVAAEAAERRTEGPGTFAPAWLDALASTDGADLAARVRLS